METKVGMEMCATEEQRMARGKEIASHPETIEKIGVDEWSVPSQSGFGRYKVVFLGDSFTCSCPDYSARAAPCKHIYAVRSLYRSGKSILKAAPKPRKQYPQHPSYTTGQTKEMRLLDGLLRDLVSDVPDFPRLPGARGPAPTPFREDL